MTTENRLAFRLLLSIFALCVLTVCLGAIFILWGSRRTLKPVSLPSAAPLPSAQIPTLRPSPAASASPTLSAVALPAGGKIVYVCQIFKSSETDQICLMNADGSEQRRLTTDNHAKHFYPSLAPDGQSVVYSSNLGGAGQYEIYEQRLDGSPPRQLTSNIGILTAPEISPDGRQIAFTRAEGDLTEIWRMERDGSHPQRVVNSGWDPSWSPDGQRIVFAAPVTGFGIQLASVRLDGSDFARFTNLPNLRGRNDWSADGLWLITYSGLPWKRELFLMKADGSAPRQLTPSGGNSQGPSFSPDSQSVVFTAYFDHYGDVHGCEIYTLRLDGSGLTRLTDNDFCDWQPRWGP